MSETIKSAGFITITVPFEEYESPFCKDGRGDVRPRESRDRRAWLWTRRDRREVRMLTADIHAAILAAWPVGRAAADRTKSLAAVDTWLARLSALEDEEIEDLERDDLETDLGVAVEAHVPFLLREIREASAALVALGIPDDGRPLAKRVRALADEDDARQTAQISDARAKIEVLMAERAHRSDSESHARGLALSEALDVLDGRITPAGDRIKAREKQMADRLAAEREKGREEGRAGATPAVRPEPPPIATGSAPIWPMVIADVASIAAPDAVKAALVEDMQARDAQGRERYRTPLTADNGRNHFVDGYQELLDGAVYQRAEIEANGPMADVARTLYPIVLSALVAACAAMKGCEHRAGGEATTPGTCADCGANFADLEDDGDPREGPMHEWFELSYASHLVLPRVVIQSMPIPWQRQLVGLLEQSRTACERAGVKVAERYYVRALDGEGRLTDEDLPHHRRAPLLGEPGWATAPRATRDEDDPVEQEREEATTQAFAEAIRLVEGLKGKAVATPEQMRQAALVVLTTRSPALADLAADPTARAAFNGTPGDLAALRARHADLADQLDAHEHADPPTAPPEDLVRAYRETGQQLAEAERAARGTPRIQITLVEPIERGTSMAFVDGPGVHGVAPIATARYPESPRGKVVRELRTMSGVTLYTLAKALRVGSAEVSGLERGSHTTDDAGWSEITTTLFKLGGTPREKRAEEAGYIADPTSRPDIGRLLGEEVTIAMDEEAATVPFAAWPLSDADRCDVPAGFTFDPYTDALHFDEGSIVLCARSGTTTWISTHADADEDALLERWCCAQITAEEEAEIRADVATLRRRDIWERAPALVVECEPPAGEALRAWRVGADRLRGLRCVFLDEEGAAPREGPRTDQDRADVRRVIERSYVDEEEAWVRVLEERATLRRQPPPEPDEADQTIGDDPGPYVCPGCHTVAGRCLPGCIDAEIEETSRRREDEDEDEEQGR